MQPTLLVLAAGMGSRYGGVKQIDGVGTSGEAIIDYSIYDAIRGGFGRVVFVIRREIADDVRQFFAGKFDGRIAVDYVFQELDDLPGGRGVPADRKKPWGTAHAVLAARDAIDVPFAVINGDDFSGSEAIGALGAQLAAVDPTTTDYSVVGYRMDNTLSDYGTVSRGVIESDADGWVTGFEEHKKLERTKGAVTSWDAAGASIATFSGQETVSMNLFGFNPNVFPLFESEFERFLAESANDPTAEFLIPLAIDRLRAADRARMRVLPTDSDWFGVTYQEDRPRVVAKIRALVQAGGYPESLWK